MTKFLTSTALILSMSLTGVTIASAQQRDNKGNQSSGRQASSAGRCPDHFASLDQDKNNRISQKEERAVREKVFSSLDQNKDNVVSRQEYVNCLISTPAFSAAAVGRGGQTQGGQQPSSLLGISEKRSEQQFKQVDANNDRKVTWDEYMEAAKAEQARSGQSASRSSGQSSNQNDASSGPASAGWAFARMDANVDGNLTMQEWTSLSDPKTIAETSFRSIDQNGDGNISKEEYQARADQKFSSSSGQSDQQADRSSESGQASSSGRSDQQAPHDVDIWEYEFWM